MSLIERYEEVAVGVAFIIVVACLIAAGLRGLVWLALRFDRVCWVLLLCSVIAGCSQPLVMAPPRTSEEPGFTAFCAAHPGKGTCPP